MIPQDPCGKVAASFPLPFRLKALFISMFRRSSGIGYSPGQGQYSSDMGKVSQSYWFVSLECGIFTGPDGTCYHDCKVAPSTRTVQTRITRSIYTHDNCQTTGRKARANLSTRKQNQRGTTSPHRSSVCPCRLNPNPETTLGSVITKPPYN